MRLKLELVPNEGSEAYMSEQHVGDAKLPLLQFTYLWGENSEGIQEFSVGNGNGKSKASLAEYPL